MQGTVTQSHYPVTRRQREKNDVKSHLLPGHIVQVCGPPMVGKSTIVTEVIQELSERSPGIIHHEFLCEPFTSFEELLTDMAKRLKNNSGVGDPQPSTNDILCRLKLLLERPELCTFHHILVFDKSEGFRTSSNDHMFLDLLKKIVGQLSSSVQITVVFTTHKKFRLQETGTFVVEVDVLSDFYDVFSILQQYAKDVKPPTLRKYAKICQETLPFPEAVRRIAEEFLTDERMEFRVPPEELDRFLDTDMEFLSQVFKRKLQMVDTWIPEEKLKSIIHFSHSIKCSFTKSYLDFVISDQPRYTCNIPMKFLLDNYVIRKLPVSEVHVLSANQGDGDYFNEGEIVRYAVHPLIVYYCAFSRDRNNMVLQGQWYDQSCNRYTEFLLRVLQRTEANMKLSGRTDLVYGCQLQEWPHVKHVIDMALHCNQSTYKVFVKAAVSTRGLILKCFIAEAYDLYRSLYDSASKFGTPSEQGVLQAILGHVMASSARLSTGGTWQEAEDCLESAIAKLRQAGPTFVYAWALNRKAIILQRQGKYEEATRYFSMAKQVTIVETDDTSLEDAFGVSPLQVKEEKITMDIFQATCFIFRGENERAQQQLLDAHAKLADECPDHPELATLLNSIGLTEERGNNNIQKALEWYVRSYNVRKSYEAFTPETLVISLNNMGMISLKQGKLKACEKRLREALEIRKRLGWVHDNTCLTLTHLGTYHMKCGDVQKAMEATEEADRILEQMLKSHDTRLKVNNALAHHKQILDIQRQRNKANGQIIYHGRTPDSYFETAIKIAAKLSGNLSDHGQFHWLMAQGHLILKNIGLSKDKYDSHRRDVQHTFHNIYGHNPLDQPSTSNRSHNQKERELYNYIVSTDYENANFSTLAQYLERSCPECETAKSFYSVEELWGRIPRSEHINSSSQPSKERVSAALSRVQQGLSTSVEESTQVKPTKGSNVAKMTDALVEHDKERTVSERCDINMNIVQNTVQSETMTSQNMTSSRTKDLRKFSSSKGKLNEAKPTSNKIQLEMSLTERHGSGDMADTNAKIVEEMASTTVKSLELTTCDRPFPKQMVDINMNSTSKKEINVQQNKRTDSNLNAVKQEIVHSRGGLVNREHGNLQWSLESDFRAGIPSSGTNLSGHSGNQRATAFPEIGLQGYMSGIPFRQLSSEPRSPRNVLTELNEGYMIDHTEQTHLKAVGDDNFIASHNRLYAENRTFYGIQFDHTEEALSGAVGGDNFSPSHNMQNFRFTENRNGNRFDHTDEALFGAVGGDNFSGSHNMPNVLYTGSRNGNRFDHTEQALRGAVGGDAFFTSHNRHSGILVSAVTPDNSIYRSVPCALMNNLNANLAGPLSEHPFLRRNISEIVDNLCTPERAHSNEDNRFYSSSSTHGYTVTHIVPSLSRLEIHDDICYTEPPIHVVRQENDGNSLTSPMSNPVEALGPPGPGEQRIRPVIFERE